jgi:hypothetical protein
MGKRTYNAPTTSFDIKPQNESIENGNIDVMITDLDFATKGEEVQVEVNGDNGDLKEEQVEI